MLTYTDGDDAAQATEAETTLEANTPVLIVADAGNYTLQAATIWQKATSLTTGALTGVYAKTVVPEGSYILTQGTTGVGFRKADGTTNTVEANRCYLTANSSATRLDIVFNDETTAVQSVAVSQQQGTDVYTLQGVRTNNHALTKGIYVKNGRKYIVK